MQRRQTEGNGKVKAGRRNGSYVTEGREERVQRERVVDGEERMGGRMPREMQRAVREAQNGKGIIWRNEEVRPGGLRVGSVKEKGPRRQTEGSKSGRTSAQAT
jgi:hypothetical protein